MKFLLWTYLLLFSATLFAQKPVTLLTDSTKSVLIHIKDGTTLRGKIVSRIDNGITLKTDNLGEINILLVNIEKIEEVYGYQRNGTYWLENQFASRYFLAASAFNIRKGETYYQNTYLFANSVTHGFSDNFSMGGGFLFFPILQSGISILFFTPKISTQIAPKLRVGVGTVAVVVSGIAGSRNTAGILYSNATYGSRDNNVTVGAGLGYTPDAISSSPVLNVSFMKRVGKKVSLVSENWLTPGNGTLFSGGIRIFGDRLSVDLAILATGPAAAVPYVDVAYKFGKRK